MVTKMYMQQQNLMVKVVETCAYMLKICCLRQLTWQRERLTLKDYTFWIY